MDVSCCGGGLIGKDGRRCGVIRSAIRFKYAAPNGAWDFFGGLFATYMSPRWGLGRGVGDVTGLCRCCVWSNDSGASKGFHRVIGRQGLRCSLGLGNGGLAN